MRAHTLVVNEVLAGANNFIKMHMMQCPNKEPAIKWCSFLSCLLRSVPSRWAAGTEHERHIGVELWQEPPHAGAGDPGGLLALHGRHLEGLPVVPAAHHPGTLRKGHRRQLTFWPARYAGICLCSNVCQRAECLLMGARSWLQPPKSLTSNKSTVCFY